MRNASETSPSRSGCATSSSAARRSRTISRVSVSSYRSRASSPRFAASVGETVILTFPLPIPAAQVGQHHPQLRAQPLRFGLHLFLAPIRVRHPHLHLNARRLRPVQQLNTLADLLRVRLDRIGHVDADR